MDIIRNIVLRFSFANCFQCDDTPVCEMVYKLIPKRSMKIDELFSFDKKLKIGTVWFVILFKKTIITLKNVIIQIDKRL